MVKLDRTIKNANRDLQRKVDKIFKEKDTIPDLIARETIPSDPQEFFEDFGGIPHPSLKDKNGQPVIIKKLAPYQYDAWKYQGNLLVIKSNKVGLTTSFSLEDFHSRLMPDGVGYDLLLVAQTQQMADEHIRDLKNLILGSIKYRKYLIEKPSPELMLGERSKKSVIFIRNRFNSKRPSRIIGIGSSESAAFSWKNVNRIHMSDVSLLPRNNQKEFFGGLYSRLANTNGIIKIESIPNGMQGEVYSIYERSRKERSITDVTNANFVEPEFKIMKVSAMDAVKAGLITKKFLEGQRRKLGELMYAQLYECEFITSGNQWYKPEWIHTEHYPVDW